jgi:Tfp pilus assembly protein PilX
VNVSFGEPGIGGRGNEAALPGGGGAPRGVAGGNRARRAQNGQALIIALILLVMAAILVLGSVYFHQQTSRQQVAHGKIVQERYLAEAGLQVTMQKLNSDEDFSEAIQNLASGQRNPFDTTAGPGSIEWGGGRITVVIEPYE